MKKIINCLREITGLAEDLRPAYLSKMGAFCTTNITTFPALPYNGAMLTLHSGKLLSALALKDTSDLAMTAYELELALCIKMVEADYDDVDLVAQGDGTIIALAGVKGSSANTTSIGNPHTPANVKYVFVDDAGQIQITQDVDKLANGRVIISFTNPAVIVVKSGNSQLKITTPEGIIVYVDIDTANKTIIENQVEGTKIKSVVANFNANGLSPVASPASVTIPK